MENSKQIEIKRSLFILDRPKTEVAEAIASTYKSIGAYWHNNSTGTGFDFSELEYLMPEFINLPSDHPEFYKKVAEYFARLDIVVPDTGLTLEIGCTTNNDFKIGYLQEDGTPLKNYKKTGKGDYKGKVIENRPYNELQYIYYRFAKGSPRVAKTMAEAEMYANKTFYIVDVEDEEKAAELKMREKELADVNYYGIADNQARVKQLLVLLGKDWRGLTKVKAKEALKLEVDKNPTRFNEAFKDELAETKYFIREGLSYGILEEVGERILEAEGKRELGRNIREAALFLQDSANTDMMRVLQARMKEALKG